MNKTSKKLAKLLRDPDRFFEDYFAKRRRRSRAVGHRDALTVRKLVDFFVYGRQPVLIPRLVVYESFHGASMSCNPYAIFQYLLRDERFSGFRHAWILKNPDFYRHQFAGNRHVELVRRGSPRHEYLVRAAQYLINNNTFEPWFAKRKGQVYVNTQHGVPIKTLGRDALGTFALGANVTRNLLHADFLVMPNTFTSKAMLSSHDLEHLFNGTIIEAGYPRFDTTLRALEERDAIRRRLGVAAGKSVILYAPTYRGSHEATADQGAHIDSLITRLAEDFGESHEILCRSHHTDRKKNADETEKLVNRIDANELLGVVDILITDYSSIAFDFIPLRKPIVYYAYDIDEYRASRGTYIDLETLPGAVCRTLEEVVAVVGSADTFVSERSDAYERGRATYCMHDDGHASQRVVEHIFLGRPAPVSYRVPQSAKLSVLVYGGGFLNNGVTASVSSLLKSLDPSRYDVYVAFNGRASTENAARFVQRVPKTARVLYYLPSQRPSASDPHERGRDEAHRTFGSARFDLAIDASGYGSLWPTMIANVVASRRLIFLHNCMKSERETRPDLADYDHLFSLYETSYDTLVNVSESSYLANAGFLPHLEKKMVYTENIIDKDRIVSLAEELIVDPALTNFINVGRYTHQKGQDRLIDAFALVHARNPQTNLYVVGHGPDHRALEAQVRRLGLGGAVHLTGNLENPFRLVKACDCFVLSSRYEGQGIAVLEALTLGVPTISTNIPGPQSILSDEFLFEDSVAGLTLGMQRFLDGKLPASDFDADNYNERALESLDALLNSG